MKTKFPLYLGITVFVLSVLMASIRIGEKGFVINSDLRAFQEQAILKLYFSEPNIISISAVSAKEIYGADITILYGRDTLAILPSTLSGFSSNITTGGEINQETGSFSFSVVSSNQPVKNGILATFRIIGTDGIDGNKLDYGRIELSDNETKIYDINMGEIPFKTSGIRALTE